MADEDQELPYDERDWVNEDGKFDWEAVFEAVEAADRDDAFWEWFADQYGTA